MTLGQRGHQEGIPLLVLMLFAAAAGCAAAPVARLYYAPRKPMPPSAGLRAKRLNPEELTGLALTAALAVIFGGGVPRM
jgi:hypothetical protein